MHNAGRPHAPGRRARGTELRKLPGVVMVKAPGNQLFERLLQDLLPGPAKHLLGRMVEQNDFLLFVHRNDGVHGRLQHARQQ